MEMRFDELFNPQLKRYRLILKNLNDGKIAIDMGSASGDFHGFLKKELGSKTIGVDFTDIDGYSKEKRRVDVDVIHDLNIFPYPFPKNYADNIVAGGLIEHLTRPLDFLNECYRILKKGGKLIITTPNMIGLQNILGKFKNDAVANQHLYYWNIDSFSYLIKKYTKFKILKMEYLNDYWAKNVFYRLICFLIPTFSVDLFAVLKK